MPFIAECTFCTKKMRVPDSALGASLACPRCGNYFTLTASASTSEPSALAPSLRAASGSLPATEVAPAETLAVEPATDPLTTTPTPQQRRKSRTRPSSESLPVVPTLDQPLPIPPPAPFAAPPPPRQLNHCGLAAFVAGCLAWFCSAFDLIAFLRFPLGLLGVVLAIFAAAVHFRSRNRGVFFPIAGAVVSLGSLVLPGLWSDAGSGRPPAEDTARALAGKQLRVPLKNGLAGTPAPVEDTDWVDASEAAVQRDDVRARIASAGIRKVEFRGSQPTFSRDRFLVLDVRVYNASGSRRLEYETWGDPGPAAKHRPTLTDNHRRPYRLHAFGSGLEPLDSVRRAPVLPLHSVRDALVFDAPSGNWESLYLELPASAAGGTGSLRLKIPRNMVTFQ
jgi:hypothetical protein